VAILTILLASAACLGAARQASALPAAESWRPEVVFRAKIERSDSSETEVNVQDGLSPDEAALLALDRNPELSALRASRGIAQAEILQEVRLNGVQIDLWFWSRPQLTEIVEMA